jgi:hypothetical protein
MPQGGSFPTIVGMKKTYLIAGAVALRWRAASLGGGRSAPMVS